MTGLQTLKKKIGEGSIGRVHLGRWQETDVAIKVRSLPPVLLQQTLFCQCSASSLCGAATPSRQACCNMSLKGVMACG